MGVSDALDAILHFSLSSSPASETLHTHRDEWKSALTCGLYAVFDNIPSIWKSCATFRPLFLSFFLSFFPTREPVLSCKFACLLLALCMASWDMLSSRSS
jgi:hypothetical protein